MKGPVLMFKNPGTLDMRFMELMGVSVKGSDAIGMFGTGLKYAIATIMRLDGEIVIHSKAGNFHFSYEDISLRNKEFKQVVVENFADQTSQRLGFTTDLGKLWEPWMAVREIYSNCLDEGGSAHLLESIPRHDPLSEETKIFVQGDHFVQAWEDKVNYFIDRSEKSLYELGMIKVYHPSEKDGSDSLFYKGIRVCEATPKAMFRYSLMGGIRLTEDRTADIRHIEQTLCVNAVMSDNEEFLRKILFPKPGSFEAFLGFDLLIFMDPSEVFMKLMAEAVEVGDIRANQNAVTWYLKKIAGSRPLKEVEPTQIQKSQIEKSLKVLRAIGFESEIARFPIVVVDWLGQGKMGQAKDSKVYLSKECFAQGTKYVCSTILEELVHLQHGFLDESRPMQTWLFDRIIHITENFILQEAI